ncbi:SRPBCC family protein [Novosphingobium sp. Chol11]|jgi:hypothetical protein|uniref:SRPBCC family protein n=1 Tax=Novosphingobium sp. Chol11 TaxID=1385763 RepID=UPI000BE3E9A8|nr:SRPBCC family protein [Novosphingobium sp. Chol11]
MRACIRAVFITAIAAGTTAQAEVKSVNDVGFSIASNVRIDRDARSVYALIVKPARWWSSEHSYSGDAANLSMDPRAGGCFCERLSGANGKAGSVEHARLILAEPYKRVRLSGALGPLQADAVIGTLELTIMPSDRDVEVTMSYIAAGYMRMDSKQMAPAIDKVLTEQLMRLKRVAEQGG